MRPGARGLLVEGAWDLLEDREYLAFAAQAGSMGQAMVAEMGLGELIYESHLSTMFSH